MGGHQYVFPSDGRGVRSAPERVRSNPGRGRVVGALGRLAAAAALVVMAPPLGGCGEPAGQIELAWRFVDGDLDPPLFPGKEADTCDLVGRRGITKVPYDLSVVLRLTPESCLEGEACDGEISARFSCKRARGVIIDVPALEERYVVETLVAVSPDDGPAFFANDECVVRPAARTRRMSTGGTIDLGVYQFLITEIDPQRGLRELRLDVCFGEALDDVDGTSGGVDDGAPP